MIVAQEKELILICINDCNLTLMLFQKHPSYQKMILQMLMFISGICNQLLLNSL